MNLQTLKSGLCPKCGSEEVYTNSGQTKRGERMKLVISGWERYFLDTYLCISCGHFEEYIAESEFRDNKIIEKIKENWKKMKSNSK